jgi:hypothetical protein
MIDEMPAKQFRSKALVSTQVKGASFFVMFALLTRAWIETNVISNDTLNEPRKLQKSLIMGSRRGFK